MNWLCRKECKHVVLRIVLIIYSCGRRNWEYSLWAAPLISWCNVTGSKLFSQLVGPFVNLIGWDELISGMSSETKRIAISHRDLIPGHNCHILPGFKPGIGYGHYSASFHTSLKQKKLYMQQCFLSG